MDISIAAAVCGVLDEVAVREKVRSKSMAFFGGGGGAGFKVDAMIL
jgi:hypothetical protein